MTDSQRPAPPYAVAAAVAVAVLIVYVATLAPTTAFWDTSEYIAAAKTLGIPHPPGNPLFVLLAHVFGLLPLAASYAVRINLFAAVTSALSAGLWFLVAERWLRNIVTDRPLRIAAAVAGVVVGALSWTVWNQSTVNEKVYTVSLFFMALVTWLAVHWGDDEPGPHRDRWLVLIAYLLALTSTNHMMGVLAAPAVAVYVLWTDWRALTRPTVLAGILVAIVVGVSPNYLFLPIRAAQHPAINEGEPAGFFSQALMDVLNRVQYGKPSVLDAPWPSGGPRTVSLFVDQLANYWQYFSWQFARDWPAALRAIATAVFAVTGLSGLWTLLKRDRRAGIAALAMMGTLTFVLIFYLNFKYGFSMYPDRPDLEREVRERDYFFVCSFAFFGTLVAAGIGALMQEVSQRFRSRAAALPLLALALVPLIGNRVTASRAHEFVARDFARDLLESVEPYGILITAGDNDTFPLWFAQEVEGIRPDVTLANLSLMNTDWHLRQIRRRQTPDFDPSKSIGLWKPRSDTSGIALGVPGREGWTKPDTPVFVQTEQELDSLPEYSKVPKGSGVKFGELEIAFGTELIDRKDLATIFLIRDNLGKRPIYFAWSAGGYPDETLGLTEYLVSQGLVRKLYTRKVEPTAGIVLTPMGYTDLERTRALLEKGYRWESAARQRPRGWVDAPSASILRLYSIVYGGMAATFRQHGDSALAARADSIAKLVDEEVKKSGTLH
jgi:VanZ family protein